MFLLLLATMSAAEPAKPSKYQATVLREPAGDAYYHIAFAAEGFQAGEKAAFVRQVERLADAIRVQPVFAKHTKQFKLSAVWVASKDSGACQEAVWDAWEKEWKPQKTTRGTAFHSFYHLERQTYKLTNFHAVRAAHAAAGWDVDVLVVLVNRAEFGGSALCPGQVAVEAYWTHKDTARPFDYDAKKDEMPAGLVVMGLGDAGGLVVHELGHAVAGLGDEYVSTQKANLREQNRQWAAYHPNVSDTPDRTKLKWKDLFGKDGVGAYEGAMDRAKGLYRPWDDGCLMGDRDQRQRFCPVCERAIHQAIDKAAAAKGKSGN